MHPSHNLNMRTVTREAPVSAENRDEEVEMLTVTQVARRLSCSRAHVYRLFKRGELAAMGDGRLRRVSRAALRDYIARHTQAQSRSA